MFVIRHNTQTGNMALYPSLEAAGSEMPVYRTEQELAAGKASITELTRLYNKLAEKPVSKFSDRATAVRRTWAAAVAKAGEESEQEKLQPEAPKGKKVGRPLGTGKFAGKTIYPKCRKNPRRKVGGKGWLSYEIILGKSEGVPYEEYVANGGRPQDLQWDIDRKWAEVK